jgi:anti-anti-sigma regulatory factor
MVNQLVLTVHGHARDGVDGTGKSLMSQQLVYESERAFPVGLVRPRGVLDALTAADLRGALLDCLAEQPVAVVLDASGLSLADDVAMTVLAGVARESTRWPGARILVADGGPELVAAADRMGVRPYLTFCPDVESALGQAKSWPVPPVARQTITPDRFAPGVAREIVREFCEANHIAGDFATAQVIASELVTNAVVHAGTPIDFSVRLGGSDLHVAVRDQSPRPARIVGLMEESAEGGRGLVLVDALARAWGSMPGSGGKTVWASVRVRVTPGSYATGGEQEV